MSDEEDQVIGSEEESAPAKDSGPSEAQLAMEKRRQHQASLGANLDEVAQAVLETSRIERERLQEEIEEMKSRNEERKRIREEEEKALAEKRAEEDAQRKAAEEERGRKKQEEEMKRREMRAARLAAYEALSLPQGRNFVITKKDGGEEQEEELDEEELANKEKKSKEQQEQEKKAILSQRIKPVNMDELNSSDKLKEKARELHNQIVRLESEKYDLEKRFKAQQYDMMELAERARQMNKVGKGGLKRLQLKEDEVDKIQERYAGAPAKVEMYSIYERQKDKRTFGDRHVVFH
ncbi:troponin, partial [Clostridium perfringens]|nr:troponin [Clostridium perfringens]